MCKKTTLGHEKTNSYKFVKKRSVADHKARGKKTKARSYRKATSVGTDAFHPRALFDLSDEAWESAAGFKHIVEVIGEWPATTRCILFFVLPKTGDSDTQIVPLVTQLQRWDWVTTDIMRGWKKTKSS